MSSKNRKRTGINIPGSVLDSIRENGRYEDDERFTKRQRIKGPSVVHRKENRKLQRQNKKQQKFENKQKLKQKKKELHTMAELTKKLPKPKQNFNREKRPKRVSFTDHNEVREIPARDNKFDSSKTDIELDFDKWEKEFIDESEDSEHAFSQSDSDSQDEQEEADANDLIQTLKKLKQVQRGEYESDEDSTESESQEANLSDEQQSIMDQLAKLKGKKKVNSSIRIVKEDDLTDDSELSNLDGEGEGSDSDEPEEDAVMKQLAALKGNKKSKSEIKIVKEDELGDDSMSQENSEIDNDSEDAVMKQLAALKGNKKSKSEIKIVKEDDLNDDSMSEDVDEEISDNVLAEDAFELNDGMGEDNNIMKKLAAIKGNRKSKSQIKIVKEEDLDDDSLSNESDQESSFYNEEEKDKEYYIPASNYKEEDDTEYYAKKLGLKGKNIQKEGEDDLVGGLFDGLDFMGNYDVLEKEVKSNETNTKKDTEKKREFSKSDTVNFKDPAVSKEEEEMEYYAKKLGIKPNAKLIKENEDDVIGGLFDGIDLGFSELKSSEKEVLDATEERGTINSNRNDDDDDEINSDDFDDDDDLDDDDKALIREMYGIENSDSDSDSEFGSEFESESDEGPRVKENPYIAPGVTSEETIEGSKYIPPALRKKMAEGASNEQESEQVKHILRLVKGPFNKLSEPTLSNVISELNNVYNDNPRQFVNEAILKVIMQSVFISTPMLESFLLLYAAAIAAINKLQGVEFGAFIIQKLIEKFNSDIESNQRTNQSILNTVGFLGYLYTLNMVGSTLIYDIIKEKLIKNPNELKTDVLLKLIKSCGSKLRTDDSTALNEIINLLSKSTKENETKGVKTSTRSRFLIDTITDLKNNRLKNMENENTIAIINRLKKQLGSINTGRNLDAIKVTLNDIENIEERGKWWLVGSAWKGNETSAPIDVGVTVFDNDNELNDSSYVNWMELAKQCRMNTDIRRAIFISIMSAEDFLDAFMKLEKLSLKRVQKLEIPNILMHCATMENNYNPYYSFLAKKLSNDHAMRRSFQLNLWDFIKELDGEDDTTTTILLESTDDERLWKILNMGRFFGFLMGEGSLPLNLLRVINFLTVSSDVELFLEIMIITLLDIIAKKSEVSSFGAGASKKSKNLQYSGKLMAERIARCNEQPLLMKGLQYFINNKLRDSNLIKGKKQRLRIDWAIETMSEMLAEMLKASE